MNGADVAFVGLAGGAGAVTRFAVDGLVSGSSLRRRLPASTPIGTMAVNVSGALVLGVLAGLVLWHHVTPTLTLVAGTGFCGGYTTFGTSSLEAVRLVERSAYAAATLAVVGTLVPALAAVTAGLYLAKL